MGFFSKKHTPQGERKLGVRVRFLYYPIGWLLAFIFISCISYPNIHDCISRVLKSDFISQIRITNQITKALEADKKIYTKDDAIKRFKEMVDEKYPLPKEVTKPPTHNRLFPLYNPKKKYDPNNSFEHLWDSSPRKWDSSLIKKWDSSLPKMEGQDEYEQYLVKRKEIEKKREEYYNTLLAQIDKILERWNKESEDEYKEKVKEWRAKRSDFLFETFMAQNKEVHSAISTIIFFIASIILSAHFLVSSSRFALIDTLGIFLIDLYKLSLPVIVLYALSLIFLKTDAGNNISGCFITFVPPALLAFFPVYLMVFIESIKETDFYQELCIEGRGREVSRWGSFASYHKNDITIRFRDASKKIYKLKKSLFYIGKTKFHYDYKLGCRHIGTSSEQHMIIVAGTGSGKSRDILNNNTLTYSGGMVIFDVKGEHVATSYEKRSKFAKTYVVDPWEKNKLGIPTDYWNPLESINIHSKEARSQIDRLCESIIIKEGNSGDDKNAHFREVPQKILRGLIAHVLSEYPIEYHNLPSVYNLMSTGNINGGVLEEEAMKDLMEEMSDNTVCENAPIDAASNMMKLESAAAEKSGVWGTLSRSLDWVKDPSVKDVISGSNTFSFRECKLEDATVYLVIPEIYLTAQKRFVRLFYQCAFDELGEHFTVQPKDHERRVLFVFDEFESLGHFERARQAVLRERSSYIKCVFVVQNFDQFQTNYQNPKDFLTNCDKLVFGVDRSDTNIMKMLRDTLGSYTDVTYENERKSETVRALMSESEIAKFMNIQRQGLLYIPVGGSPMKLKRIHYDSNFWEHKRGGIIKRCIGNYQYAKAQIKESKKALNKFLDDLGFFGA